MATQGTITTTCDRCENAIGREFGCIGNFSAVLCPRCQNEMHTYLMKELEFTNYNEIRSKWERERMAGDPLIFPSINLEFTEAEWKMHEGLTLFVYGSDALNPQPKAAGQI